MYLQSNSNFPFQIQYFTILATSVTNLRLDACKVQALQDPVSRGVVYTGSNTPFQAQSLVDLPMSIRLEITAQAQDGLLTPDACIINYTLCCGSNESPRRLEIRAVIFPVLRNHYQILVSNIT